MTHQPDCGYVPMLKPCSCKPTPSTYDLIREGRKHDAAMAPTPWHPHVWCNTYEGGHAAVGPHHKSCDDAGCDHAPGSCSDSERADVDAAGITWLRNNLGALLDRLETADCMERMHEPAKTRVDEHIAGLTNEREAGTTVQPSDDDRATLANWLSVLVPWGNAREPDDLLYNARIAALKRLLARSRP